MINLYNIDCMEFMKDKPDNYYDLAIVDPPYMDDINEYMGMQKRMGGLAKTKVYDNIEHFKKPDIKYFKELKRVSKNQIIWGVNHYENYLGKGRIIWDKKVTGQYNHAELAYQSKSNSIRIFTYTWNGMLQEDMKNKQKRIHPTEKPIQLYEWLLDKYAKKGDKILDTHGGSMSIAIACHNLGFDLDCCELDKEYFEQAKKRFEEHTKQIMLTDMIKD